MLTGDVIYIGYVDRRCYIYRVCWQEMLYI